MRYVEHNRTYQHYFSPLELHPGDGATVADW